MLSTTCVGLTSVSMLCQVETAPSLLCVLTATCLPSCISKVTACLSSYFELRPCRPRLEKLKHLLAECPYRGPEYEGGGELVEDEVAREEGGQPKGRKMPQKVSSLRI